MFNKPILFLIFNRPDTTKIVFDAIRKIQPTKLYVAADGYRENKKGEKEACELTRSIIETVDWKCEVKKLYRDKNFGCKKAISSAVDWFFENEEEGIILEDDCLPDLSFFNFCEQMLEYYRNVDRIMHIAGINFQFGRKRGAGSYYFSRNSHVWGWASWRRAWKYYDVTMRSFPEFKKRKKIHQIVNWWPERSFILNKLEKTYRGEIDTWDYQWNFAMWEQNGLAIIPNQNLISNIGFDKKATHTTDNSKFSKMGTSSIDEIIHPSIIEVNVEADDFSFRAVVKDFLIAKLASIGSAFNSFSKANKKNK